MRTGKPAIPSPPASDRRAAIAEWLQQSKTEVLVLVEGEENITGCSVQARYSYTADDIVSLNRIAIFTFFLNCLREIFRSGTKRSPSVFILTPETAL